MPDPKIRKQWMIDHIRNAARIGSLLLDDLEWDSDTAAMSEAVEELEIQEAILSGKNEQGIEYHRNVLIPGFWWCGTCHSVYMGQAHEDAEPEHLLEPLYCRRRITPDCSEGEPVENPQEEEKG